MMGLRPRQGNLSLRFPCLGLIPIIDSITCNPFSSENSWPSGEITRISLGKVLFYKGFEHVEKIRKTGPVSRENGAYLSNSLLSI